MATNLTRRRSTSRGPLLNRLEAPQAIGGFHGDSEFEANAKMRLWLSAAELTITCLLACVSASFTVTNWSKQSSDGLPTCTSFVWQVPM